MLNCSHKMYIVKGNICSFSFAILVLVIVCSGSIIVNGENVMLKKNNMINMADREFDYHKLTKRRDLDPETCVDNFDIHRDKIIRTEDSREMGAKYLNEIDLGSRDECLRLCCETESCDVFVFEEKNPGSCYLFHCGPPEDFKCKFTRHTNFSSAVLAVNRHLAELEDQIKLTKHEQDLASLRKQVQIQDQPPTQKSLTVRPNNANIQPETNPPPPSRKCSRFQFECHSSDECIAIYNACDGIPQCADGSDEAPELGCPGTTTLPPAPNLPPREILPQIPQTQQMSMYSASETIPKDKQNQHQQAFMRPISSVEGPPWPRQLDSTGNNNIVQHIKQFNDNASPSHIFNHKGGLQVTETDNIAPAQYEYKGLPYDAVPENNNWMHRQWPQQEQININDGSPIYHMEMDPQNSWKQQPVQNIPMQPRISNVNSQMQSPRIMGPNDKMMMQGIANTNNNIYQNREKIWPVQLMPNIQQENPQVYSQPKVQPPLVENKVQTENNDNLKPTHNVEKNDKEPPNDGNEETENDSEDNSEEDNDKVEETSKKNKHNESKTSKKNNANKTKKKHLKQDAEVHKESNEKDKTHEGDDEKTKNVPVHEQMIQGKQFAEDVHDGAAERPPGAILLLTLGVCMTSIMVVLIGCRLKMARRRMRRSGKSPFAHDADYLVNGMYL